MNKLIISLHFKLPYFNLFVIKLHFYCKSDYFSKWCWQLKRKLFLKLCQNYLLKKLVQNAFWIRQVSMPGQFYGQQKLCYDDKKTYVYHFIKLATREETMLLKENEVTKFIIYLVITTFFCLEKSYLFMIQCKFFSCRLQNLTVLLKWHTYHIIVCFST